jgi:hypothetical protein
MLISFDIGAKSMLPTQVLQASRLEGELEAINLWIVF